MAFADDSLRIFARNIRRRSKRPARENGALTRGAVRRIRRGLNMGVKISAAFAGLDVILSMALHERQAVGTSLRGGDADGYIR